MGAVRAFQLLQKDGLGQTIEFGRGINKVSIMHWKVEGSLVTYTLL